MTTPFDGYAEEDAAAAVLTYAAQHSELYLQGSRFERNDPGNANRLGLYFGEHLRYIKRLDAWRNWDGRRWNPSTKADLMRIARQVVTNTFIEVTVSEEDQRAAHSQHANRSAAKSRMDNMMQVAIGDDKFWRDLNDFDHNPYLVNFLNGTVDIRNDKNTDVRPHDPLDYITQLVPHKYNPEAKAPEWEKLVARVVQTANADKGTLRFLQKALGYSILGGNMEHMIFFLTGSERCGKSKILEIIRALITDEYSHISKPDLISKKKNGHHDSEMYSIIGKRFVCISEVSGSFNLDESQVKSLTGESVQTARKLRDASELQVPMTWTIWLSTNDNPSVQAWDGAIAERVVVIPCGPTVPPEERIPDLDQRIIHQEAEGVLAWLIEGARMWYRDQQEAVSMKGMASTGLAKPPSVLEAGSSYAVDSDYIAAFIEDHIEYDPESKLRRPDVFDRFKRTRGPGEKPERNKLYARLESLPGVTVSTAREFVGIRLKANTTMNNIDWTTLMHKPSE